MNREPIDDPRRPGGRERHNRQLGEVVIDVAGIPEKCVMIDDN